MENEYRKKFLSFLKDRGYVVREKEDKSEYRAPDICYLCKNRHEDLGLCAQCIQLLEPNEYLDYEAESEG